MDTESGGLRCPVACHELREKLGGKIKRDEIHDSKTLAAWALFEKMVEGKEESPKSKV